MLGINASVGSVYRLTDNSIANSTTSAQGSRIGCTKKTKREVSDWSTCKRGACPQTALSSPYVLTSGGKILPMVGTESECPSANCNPTYFTYYLLRYGEGANVPTRRPYD